MSAPTSQIVRTVIVGAEFPAALIAAALARCQDPATRPVHVLVRPRGATDPVCSADTTLPWFDLPRLRGPLAEDAVIAADGGFSWGIALTGWSGVGRNAFLPFGSAGAQFGPIGFQHLVHRLRRDGEQLRFANFALAALAAQAGRFERPGKDPRSVLSTAEYGLHLEMGRVAEYLRSKAAQAGVVFETCTGATVQRAPDGRAAALVTGDGRRIEGDFFIDCTSDGLLSQGTDSGNWNDWSAWLRADRVLTCHVETTAAPEPFSEVRAIAGGWLRRVPLAGRAAITARFSSKHVDDTTLHVALRELAGAVVNDVRIRHARAGRMNKPWRDNILALGTAAASADPLVVSDLQLLCVGVERLLQLLPADSQDMRAEASEFNRRFGSYADRARDLAIAMYWLNGRRGEPFWDALRQMPVPESLSGKRDLYASLGQVALYDDEPVEHWSWISLFDELGLRPQNYSPLANGEPKDQLLAHAAKARALMLEAVARMPSHGAYLAGVKTQSKRGSS